MVSTARSVDSILVLGALFHRAQQHGQSIRWQDYLQWGMALHATADSIIDQPQLERDLRLEAIERLQQSLICGPEQPNQANVLSHWGHQLSVLASLSSGVDDQRRLRHEAVERYRLALEADPQMAYAAFAAARELGRLAARSTGEPEREGALLVETAEFYRRAIALEPDRPDALFNWANARGRLAKLSTEDIHQQRALCLEAIELYRRALELEPDLHEALGNRGLRLSELAKYGEWEADRERALVLEAIEDLRRALAIQPDQRDLLHNWGVNLSRLAMLSDDDGDEARALYREAVERFRQALTLEPNDFRTFAGLAAALSELGTLDANAAPALHREAIELLEKLQGTHADRLNYRIMLGVAFGRLAGSTNDDVKERSARLQAIGHYQSVLEREPESLVVLQEYGNELGALASLSDDGEGERALRLEAIEYFQRVLELEPDDDESPYYLGVQLIELARLEGEDREQRLARAEHMLTRYASLSGDPITQLYAWSRLLALRGQRTRALDSLRQCLAHGTVTVDQVRADEDWSELRGDPGFEELLDPGG